MIFTYFNYRISLAFCLQYLSFCIVTTINFDQSAYSIDEHDGAIHPVLSLTKPLSKDVTVKVISSDGSADGEYLQYYLLCKAEMPSVCLSVCPSALLAR